MRLTHSQIQSITHALESCSPAVIYIFGSHGTSSQHPNSDIDIAFLPTISAPAYHTFQISNALSSELGTQIDLINLRLASTVLCKEVLRTGEPIIIANESIKREFEMRTLADYSRLNEERREILAAS
jgi:predicted nucleotidyltransferase